MRRVALVTAGVAIVVMTWVTMAGAAPVAPYTSSDCAGCHGATGADPWGAYTKTDFTVGTVDKGTACPRCHNTNGYMYSNPAGLPPHHSYPYRCRDCHSLGGPWKMQYAPRFARTSTAYGFFRDPASVNKTPQELHAIHKAPRWPAQITYGPYDYRSLNCSGCHAVASCDACHESVQQTHGQHSLDPATGEYGVSPWVGDVSTGTADYRATPNISAEKIACSATGCHGFDVAPVPERIEDNSPAMTYSGTWVWDNASGVGSVWYENESARYTDVAASSVTASFTGTEVGIVGPSGTGYGIFNVFIDGELAGTVDQYLGIGAYYTDRIWTRSGLTNQEHNITIVSTGLRNPASYQARVLVDRIEYSTPSGAAFVPQCLECHAEKSDYHGYQASQHSADLSVREAGDGHLCSECHSADLMTEHAKVTSSSESAGCATCHAPGGAVSQMGGAWDRSCTAGPCHADTSAQPIHKTYCQACHENGSTDFSVKQTDFTAPALTKTKCLACHGTGITNAGSYKQGRRWVSFRHLSHNATDECAYCHYWEPRRTEFYTHTVKGAYGFFASVDSTNPASARAHSVHVNGSWAQSLEFAPQIYCRNCHAVAGCGSCHEVGSMPLSHANHGTQTTQTVLAAPGAASYTAPKATLVPETRSCTAAACHGADATKIPTCTSCHTDRIATHW